MAYSAKYGDQLEKRMNCVMRRYIMANIKITKHDKH